MDCTFYAIRETFYDVSSLKTQNRQQHSRLVQQFTWSVYFLKHPVREGKHNGKDLTEMGPKTKRNKYHVGSSFV